MAKGSKSAVKIEKDKSSLNGEAPKKDWLRFADIYWYVGILLALFVSFYLRAIIPLKNVFIDGTVRFASDGDAWYHMMLATGTVFNLKRLWFDPMTNFPHGLIVTYGPFNDWSMAIISLIVGLGHPSTHTIDIVGAFLPAILGALVVVPVYFIGRKIGGRSCGLVSAFLMAVLPGGVLYRTTLGFTKDDAAELLLSTLTMMFFMMAVMSGRDLSFGSIRENWPTLRRPLIYALLAGVSLGLYLDTWPNGFLFEGILIGFVVFQSIIDHLKGRDVAYLSVPCAITFAIAMLMVLPFVKLYSGFTYYEYSLFQPTILILGIFFVLLILFASNFLRGCNRCFFPAAVIGIIVLGFLVLLASLPQFMGTLVYGLSIFLPKTGGAATVAEVSPLLYPEGQFSLGMVYGEFPGLGIISPFFLALAALVLLLFRYRKDQNPANILMVVWSLTMLLLALAQNRFSEYYAVNVTLLNGCLAAFVLHIAGFGNLRIKSEEAKVSAKSITSNIKIAAVVLAIILVLIYPSLSLSIETAGIDSGLEPDWVTSTSWLQNNTPSPGLDLYKIYDFPPKGKTYSYPPEAYGVMSWWDYGDFIEAIGHRMPNSNPFQQGIGSLSKGTPGSSPFFISESEDQAEKVLSNIDKNRSAYLNSRYVMIDVEMATGKFPAMAAWSLVPASKYISGVYQAQSDQLVPAQVWRESFYKTMTARLYFYDGCETSADGAEAIAYNSMQLPDGEKVPVLTKSPKISQNYSELEDFVNLSRSQGDNAEIIGLSPESSAVPLEALKHYRLVHESETTATDSGQKYVKIFENVPGAVIKGKAPAGTKATIAVPITTNQNRNFIYSQSNVTGSDGQFMLVVPYSTEGPIEGGTKFDTKPIRNYQLVVGSKTDEVRVPEEMVMAGGVIKI